MFLKEVIFKGRSKIFILYANLINVQFQLCLEKRQKTYKLRINRHGFHIYGLAGTSTEELI